MFSLNLNKNKQLIKQLDDLFNISEDILTEFKKAIFYISKNKIDSHFEVLVNKISELENDADEIIKYTKYKIISQSLLPETREDLLEILDAMDNIPDNCESAAYMINDQQLLPIDQIKEDLLELVDVGIECYKYTILLVKDFLNKMNELHIYEEKIDDTEHVGDKLERKLIHKIFSDDSLSVGEKILQKQLVKEIGELCDISQYISKKIITASIKRKI
ncbi:MAG TPA: DUF47 family protein [Victivallales bacterium]|nr:DUF47 family protein [Victivallales bacterium]